MFSPHPGKDIYPDLKEPLVVRDLGEFESSLIEVRDGKVTLSRWDEDIDDRVSFVITEWDFCEFVGAWLDKRMDQKFPVKAEKLDGNYTPCTAKCGQPEPCYGCDPSDYRDA